MQNDKITPFTINVTQDVLSDVQLRLQNTRWSYQVEGTKWDAGTDLNYVRELVAYWQDGYDWCKQEAALNEFAHFKSVVDEIGARRSPARRSPCAAASCAASSRCWGLSWPPPP